MASSWLKNQMHGDVDAFSKQFGIPGQRIICIMSRSAWIALNYESMPYISVESLEFIM